MPTLKQGEFVGSLDCGTTYDLCSHYYLTEYDASELFFPVKVYTIHHLR